MSYQASNGFVKFLKLLTHSGVVHLTGQQLLEVRLQIPRHRGQVVKTDDPSGIYSKTGNRNVTIIGLVYVYMCEG